MNKPLLPSNTTAKLANIFKDIVRNFHKFRAWRDSPRLKARGCCLAAQGEVQVGTVSTITCVNLQLPHQALLSSSLPPSRHHSDILLLSDDIALRLYLNRCKYLEATALRPNKACAAGDTLPTLTRDIHRVKEGHLSLADIRNPRLQHPFDPEKAVSFELLSG